MTNLARNLAASAARAELLYAQPAVREAAVIGIPHAELGEEVGATVALKDGATATPEEPREHVKRQAAADKYPGPLWIIAELPKTSAGKILRRTVEAPASETAPRTPG